MGLDNILLGLLRQPASGYDLKRVFDEGIGHFWAAELSQIYPALKRLEKRRLLRARKVDSKRGPGKYVYQTTAAGQAARPSNASRKTPQRINRPNRPLKRRSQA